MNHHLRSFKAKVTIVLIFSMLSIGLLHNVMVHEFLLRTQLEQLRDKLKIIARMAARTIDVDALTLIPLNRDGIYTPQYKKISDALNAIKKENTLIRYIYTITKTSQEGIWQFIVDPDPRLKKKKGVTAYPGDAYNASRFPQMLKAYKGATADTRLEKDEWGVTLSAYAPIYNDQGMVVAIVGVDMLASDVYLLQKEVYLRSLCILMLAILISVVFGLIFSKRITVPIKKLIEGTRRISKGDLSYKVYVKGDDEISELADSFNDMADSLHQAQKKNQNYFYDVIQSLVRIVEAKDSYTRGHSERVADLAAGIAARMGFPKERIELLKEVAMIHDIGKLGIQDDVLNKKEPLTSEEWEVVRKHPALGEDIVRPISLDREILLAVRGHHEHFDGKGYPDKLSGDDIGIFAQILSVADAYDAMVSSRAYRKALNKEEAIEELKRNAGTQFSPKVVEVFTHLLRESS